MLGLRVDNSAFEKLLLETLADFSPTISKRDGAYHVSAESGVKRVNIVWPYPLGEVFLDFLEHGEVLHADWVDYYNGEETVEQVEDIARVVRNFLHNETRVAVLGSSLEDRELQYWMQTKWISIFYGAPFGLNMQTKIHPTFKKSYSRKFLTIWGTGAALIALSLLSHKLGAEAMGWVFATLFAVTLVGGMITLGRYKKNVTCAQCHERVASSEDRDHSRWVAICGRCKICWDLELGSGTD
jgi:hypothetical protein